MKITKKILIEHFTRFDKIYLVLLFILVISSFLVQNSVFEDEKLLNSASYSHVINSQEISFSNLHYFPVFVFEKFLGDYFYFFPILIGILFLVLIYYFLSLTSKDKFFRFVFIGLIITTPATIYALTSLSIVIYFVMLIIFGFLMLNCDNKKVNYFSILPLIIATYFDFFSSIIVLIFVGVYFLIKRKKYEKMFSIIYFIVLFVIGILQVVINKQKFILNLVENQGIITNLISDLGAISGVSFFLLILSIVGFFSLYKKRKLLWLYLFVPYLFVGYYLNVNYLLYFSFVLIFLATHSICSLANRKWSLEGLSKITVWLIVLGIVFSTTTYLDSHEALPTSDNVKTLTWMGNNLKVEDRVFTQSDFVDIVKYYVKNDVILVQNDELYSKIYDSTYITDLFPVLEEENINIIYLPNKDELRDSEGLVFLLKNERFKMIYSSKNSEVWEFN
jgi:hypothetical protein